PDETKINPSELAAQPQLHVKSLALPSRQFG
ncbi:right-handed parallel beta-helix repeat-containing protein, partial [Sinorhizobium meliloti]